jgi:hypothetical protein
MAVRRENIRLCFDYEAYFMPKVGLIYGAIKMGVPDSGSK